MVIINFLDNKENDRYIIDPSSVKLGRRYDDNAEQIQVIFPENEVDTKCTMIVKDSLNKGVDLIEFTNGEIKDITTTLSQFEKVLIGFVFTNENYAKYSSYKTFYFEPSLYPDNFEPREPEFKGSYLGIINDTFASVRKNESLIEFLNIKGDVVDSITIVGGSGGGITNETDPTVPSYVKGIKQEDINKWNNKIDNTADNLLNYYLKKDTYTKDEVNQLISAIRTLKKEIVAELPTTNIDDNTIYLVPKTSGSGNGNDYYNEYLYINGNFEFIGSTQVDLNGYVKTETLNEVKKTIPTFTTTLLEDGSYSLSITTPKE